MKARHSGAWQENSAEIAGLIETLHQTEQRLEALTGGQVDTVANRDGLTVMLRRAQERLRTSEAIQQNSIVNALPANIAILDAHGFITSINHGWQRFSAENALTSPAHGVGLSYLDICDQACGNDAGGARDVAAGIRAVLSGKSTGYSIEYPCHSPAEQRWFLMTATPLAYDHSNGAVVMHFNITARHQAETALEQMSTETVRRERILNTTLSSITDFAYTFDRTGRFIFANKPLLKLWDVTLEDVVGKNFQELGYPVELAEKFQRQVTQVLTTNQAVSDVSAYSSPTGKAGFYEYLFSPVSAPDGTVEYVVGSSRDVTERRQLMEFLRSAEQEQRHLAEQLTLDRSSLMAAQQVARIGSWQTDLATLAVTWSDQTHRIFETDPTTFHVTHPDFLTFVHPDDRHRLGEALEHSLDSAVGSGTIEHRLLFPDGRIKFVEERWQVSFDKQRVARLVTGTCQDITERREGELALRASEEKFRQLAENISDVFWIRSPDLSEVHYVSPAFSKVWGRPVDVLYSDPKQWEDFIYPDDRTRVMAAFARFRDGRAELEMEYRIVRPGGEIRWVHVRGFQVKDAAGTLVRLAGIVTDITVRKAGEAARTSLELQLRESQKMEAIGTLAGGIAHDFNNILVTILGNVDLARQDAADSPRALESLEEIRKAGTRARNLVQQILSFSRRQPTERKPVALAGVVEEAARLLRATIPARIVLDVHCDRNVPAVLADATSMEQVLINLSANAIQAIRRGPGLISFRLDTVFLDRAFAGDNVALRDLLFRRPGNVVRLTVSDNGTGMDAATKERIFEPFFTTKGVDEGTGLGLSVVHGIMLAHEGAIVVTSIPGEGTTFSLYLPPSGIQQISALPAQGTGEEQFNPDAGRSRHVLYLDDDEALVFLVRRQLERRGLRCSGFTDQVLALNAIRAAPLSFDLLVTDYNMPGMSGLDVSREAHGVRADLPIAIASGFVDETLQAEAAGAHVGELIFKGAVDDFCDNIQRALKVSLNS